MATKSDFFLVKCPGIFKSPSCYAVGIPTPIDGTESYVKRRKKTKISQTSSHFNHYDLDNISCSSDTPINCFISKDEGIIYVCSID